MNLFVELILFLSVVSVNVNSETFDQCNGVPSQTFIASTDGCAFYIYCDGDESFQDKCLDDLLFNVEDGSCDLADNVDCDLNNATRTTSQFADSSTNTELETTTLATSTVFSPTPDSTSVSTSVSTPVSTSLPDTTSTTKLSTTSTPSSMSTTTSSGVIQCPTPSRPDEILYLRSPTSCTEYYMCYRGTPIPMTCPVDLEFNPMTLSCDWAESANCKVIGPTTVSPRVLCTNTTSGYYDYPSNCHYYYRCTNGMLIVQECPMGFGWDSRNKICTKNACPASKSGYGVI